MNKALTIIIFLTIFLLNPINTLKAHYFIWDNLKIRMPPNSYGFGPTYLVFDNIARKIVIDSEGKPFKVEGKAFLGKYLTGIDNFKYLILEHGGKISSRGDSAYFIYAKEDVKNSKSITSDNISFFYNDKYFYVFKQTVK